MKNKLKILCVVVFLSLLTGCWYSTDWTAKEREEFNYDCEGKKYFDIGSISFSGFDFDEIDTVMIIEKEGLKVCDTLFIHSNSKIDKKDHSYFCFIYTQFNLNHSYEFYIGAEIPYILYDFDMEMFPEYTMAGEGWGCHLNAFTIDSLRFEECRHVRFIKREINC